MAVPRIVIVGGGFAGVKCVKTLRKRLKLDECEIVLFNRENHMVFHPLLAEVVGASINPIAVAVPLRQMLPRTSCRTEDVSQIDLEKSELEYTNHSGFTKHMPYDHLVISCGSVVNMSTVPGMADHAFPLKTVGDAMTLRTHVVQQLEKAEHCSAPEKKRWYLSFVVVGGGYSGVETAGEINDLARSSKKFYQNIRDEDISVTLIHSRDQILPEISSKLRDFARIKMEKTGIKFMLKKRVGVVTTEGVGLKDGSWVKGGTVVSTIGTTMPRIIERLGVPKERGRMVADPDMRLKGQKNVWVIGDCAHIHNSYDGSVAPPTGQFAEREGRQVAENIVRVIKGQSTKPFRFKLLGQLCSIGGHTAVAEMMGLRISGFTAWFLWRSVYLLKMPSVSRRIKVGFDWAWALLFSRDLMYVKTDRTERVSHAYYHAGDYVYRTGEPATSFYVIEKGEVEIIKNEGQDNETLLAVLGQGNFFGEMALLNNRPRSANVRARSNVELTVMGRHVFSQISTSLAPLRDMLTAAVKKRSESLWQRIPTTQKVLSQYSISEFLSPPKQTLQASSTYEEVSTMFNENALGFCYVVDDQYRLQGVVTRTDLFRAFEVGTRRDAKVSEFMIKDPIAMTLNDSCLLAIATMNDHNLKWIPVIDDCESRRLQGYVRAQKMLHRVLQDMG